MKCPICGIIVKNSHICPRCNENAYVLNKIFNISVRLYNEALQKAKQKDFSNAICLIEKSLCFNKNNIEARNLLGLLYYQTGRLGDAVKQWVLSSNINQNKNNKAFYYLDIFNKNIRIFEKLDDSVRLYNQAIKYLKHRDDDLAVIRLKKSLSINPNFIDAMNLLSFCYIIQRKYKRALKISNKVLLLDKDNKIALRYLEEIESKNKKNKKEVLSEEYTYNGMVKTIDEDEEDSKVNINNNSFIVIFSFIFGIVLCSLCMYFLFIPEYVNKKSLEIEQLNNKISDIKDEESNIILQKDEDIKVLKQQNEEIKKQLQVYIDKDNIDANYKKIDEALTLYKDGKKTEAKNVIDSINSNGFSEQQLKEYNSAKNKIN
ncbi:MAG: hypothetical protein KIC92_01525 [Clostridiales bacterium]|nr:hypothetical protein [Clostridiales bacterium]